MKIKKSPKNNFKNFIPNDVLNFVKQKKMLTYIYVGVSILGGLIFYSSNNKKPDDILEIKLLDVSNMCRI
jgi:hypothetical protein